MAVTIEMNQAVAVTQPLIEQYHDQGYVIVDTRIPQQTLDGVVTELEEFWNASRLKKIVNHLWYANAGRVPDAWLVSENARQLATFPHVLRILESLYQRKPLPLQTLNFRQGTEQKVHADCVHFNSEPFGLMCGVWIALEDIGPDQGPLVFYPGSHQLPEMNFEYFGLQPTYKNYPEYERRIEAVIEERQLDPVYGTIKKGQAIIWAANLLHGGAKQGDPAATRHSQVTHYFFDRSKYWRPVFSAPHRRKYFKPNWIPETEISRTWRPVVGLRHRLTEFMQRFF